MANAQFPLITQNLSLDLVNTEIVSYDKRHDLIQSEKDLMTWFEIMGETAPFLNSFTLQQVQERLHRIHQFRAELRKHFERIVEGSEPSQAFISFLQDQIAAAPFSYQIIDGKLARIPNGKPDDAILSLIAYDALWLIHTKKSNS